MSAESLQCDLLLDIQFFKLHSKSTSSCHCDALGTYFMGKKQVVNPKDLSCSDGKVKQR